MGKGGLRNESILVPLHYFIETFPDSFIQTDIMRVRKTDKRIYDIPDFFLYVLFSFRSFLFLGTIHMVDKACEFTALLEKARKDLMRSPILPLIILEPLIELFLVFVHDIIISSMK